MITILFGIQVILAVALVISILLQRSDQDGFGLGSGSGGMGLLSGRTKANLLTRTTAILATLFMLNSILLTVMMSGGKSSSLLDKIQSISTPQQEAPATTAPAVPREGAAPAMNTAPVTEPAEKAPAEEAPATNETTSEPTPEPTPEPTQVPKAE